jgi:hypothetical protein
MNNNISNSTKSFENPLPGVPLIESPFFDKFFNEAQTDSELLRIARDLNTFGYAVLDFPDIQFSRLADKIIDKLTKHFAKDISSNTGNNGRIQDAWKFSPEVNEIATNPIILTLLQSLYGRPGWPFQTLNFRYGSQQHPHTDAVHFSSVPERFMCGVWVALEDVVLEAGPLVYYPTSHHWPIYANEHINHSPDANANTTQAIYHPLWNALVEQHHIKPERFMAKKGQTLIWTANLLHGGERRLHPELTRWSQVTHYYFEGCTYLTPMLSDTLHGKYRYRQPINLITGESLLGPKPFFTGMVAPIGKEEFNEAAYLRDNPDVAAAQVDAYTHYVDHGFAEGRWLK